MDTYQPLHDHLANYEAGDELTLTFSEIEHLVGRLPLEARRRRQWWANGADVQAQAWQAAGWRTALVDMATEQVLFTRSPVAQRDEAGSQQPRAESRSALREYISSVHVPLVVVLVFVSLIVGAIGFAFRPGRDEPPIVSSPQIMFYVFQQQSTSEPAIDPTHVSLDETMIQENSSTVLVQVDVFASFAAAGKAQWNMGTGVSEAQPYSCPDPYTYLGTAQPNPVVFGKVAGQALTPALAADFAGHRSTKTAANVLGLFGQSPARALAGVMAPVAEVDLCWQRDLPMAVNGQFTSAALPTLTVGSATGSEPATIPMDVTRSLYFENPIQLHQPITAEYNLQAGTLPDKTDPFGWHWSDNRGGLVQLTAQNIPEAQHEAYLGFVSGVLFGVVGGAVVLVLQELLEPIRRTTGDARTER